MDKDVAKERFKAKIQALPSALASHLVLKKVHLVDNGYGVNLFFVAVPEGIQDDVVQVFRMWAGEGGEVRFLSRDEVVHQARTDANYENQKRQESAPLEDLSGMTSLLTLCIQLQGEPVKQGPTRDMQQKTSGLAVKCLRRAQAAKDRAVNKRRRLLEDSD